VAFSSVTHGLVVVVGRGLMDPSLGNSADTFADLKQDLPELTGEVGHDLLLLRGFGDNLTGTSYRLDVVLPQHLHMTWDEYLMKRRREAAEKADVAARAQARLQAYAERWAEVEQRAKEAGIRVLQDSSPARSHVRVHMEDLVQFLRAHQGEK
jgi:hypothetical protein